MVRGYVQRQILIQSIWRPTLLGVDESGLGPVLPFVPTCVWMPRCIGRLGTWLFQIRAQAWPSST